MGARFSSRSQKGCGYEFYKAVFMNIIIITAIFAFAAAFILGSALGFFRKFFAVVEDPLKGSIRESLPGANCGACGYPGCDCYASAVNRRWAQDFPAACGKAVGMSFIRQYS
jgi:Na+-translocating ferredoxin:NAD+ oxidoreductase RNF subunit RnfB